MVGVVALQSRVKERERANESLGHKWVGFRVDVSMGQIKRIRIERGRAALGWTLSSVATSQGLEQHVDDGATLFSLYYYYYYCHHLGFDSFLFLTPKSQLLLVVLLNIKN